MKLLILKDLRFNSLHAQSLSLDFLHITSGTMNSKWGIGSTEFCPSELGWGRVTHCSYKRHILRVHLHLLCAGIWGTGRDKNPFQEGSQAQEAGREWCRSLTALAHPGTPHTDASQSPQVQQRKDRPSQERATPSTRLWNPATAVLTEQGRSDWQ